jgi:hypothetical protein
VITREQALAHGLSRHSVDRLVLSGAWQRLAGGIFLTVPLEPSWDSLAWAGVLLGGESARLGPESSGFLHQLLPEVSDPVDVLVPRTGSAPRLMTVSTYRGGSCRVLAAQSAPIFACPIEARRVEACVSFFRVRLPR